MKGVLYDVRWIGNHGIGRFAQELANRFTGFAPFDRKRRPWHPLDPVLLGAELWATRTNLFFSPGYNSPVGWPGQFIFTLHDLNHLRVPENSNALKRSYYSRLIRPACRRASVVLTVSEYSRNEIAEWAEVDAHKIINVGNGVGPPFGITGDKHEPGYPYLLYVGSRKPHKNLRRLLQAYTISGIAECLVLVLSGVADPNTLAQIRALGLEGKVVFLPLETTEDLGCAYRGATGFVFPSLYEGFGLPPLEAMACGVPVLTSNACSLPEVAGDAALLVNPLEVEEIAAGLTRLATDSELRTQLRKKGLERAQKFSWDETARRVANAIAFAAGGTAAGEFSTLQKGVDELLSK